MSKLEPVMLLLLLLLLLLDTVKHCAVRLRLKHTNSALTQTERIKRLLITVRRQSYFETGLIEPPPQGRIIP